MTTNQNDETTPAATAADDVTPDVTLMRLAWMGRYEAVRDADDQDVLNRWALDGMLITIRERAGNLSGQELIGLNEKVLELTEPRLCACGCGREITSARPEAIYATGACRVRAHRAYSR